MALGSWGRTGRKRRRRKGVVAVGVERDGVEQRTYIDMNNQE